jgi:polyhydroxyalkanoate synthesis regulator phasin
MTDKVREAFEDGIRKSKPLLSLRKYQATYEEKYSSSAVDYMWQGFLLAFRVIPPAQQSRIDELERQVESLRIANKIQLGARADCGRCADLERRLKEAESMRWEPKFEAMSPKQEQLAQQFSMEIAGPRGGKPSLPDPVRLLEIAEALYQAERDDSAIEQGKDKP